MCDTARQQSHGKDMLSCAMEGPAGTRCSGPLASLGPEMGLHKFEGSTEWSDWTGRSGERHSHSFAAQPYQVRPACTMCVWMGIPTACEGRAPATEPR